MKPLRLHLGGFSCFREPVEVHFDDLELFAISGPTGAGKTTLLDAITYALYGQTPRLGGRPTSHLISPGLAQLFVTFEFSTDASRCYRVTRVAERKGGRIPKSETRIEALGSDGRWRQLPESERLKDADRKLSELVGLDYESFTRAVLLPQGAFDQFLRGGAAERNRLLVGLLGLEKVQLMQQRAGERSRQAADRVAWIHDALARDYAEVSPERQCALEDDLAALELRRQELERDKLQVAEARQALEEVKALLGEQRAVEAELAALKAQAVQMQQARQALARAREAAQVAPWLKVLNQAKERVAHLQARRAVIDEALGQATERVTTAEQALVKAQQDAARLPEIAAQLEALARVVPLVALLKARGGDLTLAQRAEPGTHYDEAAWEALREMRARLPALTRAVEDVAEGEVTVAAVRERLAEHEARTAKLREELEVIARQGKAARERFERAEAAYRQAEVLDRAAALRAHLHVGEPCPVCRQVVSAVPEEAGVEVTALAKERDQAKAALEALRERHVQVKGQFEAAQAQREERTAELDRAEAGLAQHRAQLQALAAELGTADPKQFGERLEAERERLLAALARSILDQAQGRDPETAVAELKAEQERLTQVFSAAQTALDAARSRRDELEAEQRSLTAQLGDLQQEVDAATRTFEAALGATSLTSAAEVQAATLPDAQVRALESRLVAYDNRLTQLSHQAVVIEAKLAGRTLDEAEYARLKAREAELAAELQRLLQRIGELGAERKRLAQALKKAQALREEAAQLEREARTYKVLHQDLRVDRFPDYLLARIQQQLAYRASAIVREVTEKRYDLVFKDGEYGVLDAWGGGEVRSARTLSGGESFIASLALALALSDTLAGHASLGALFLDEGFGTLDAETLDAVTGVLQALTARGRMVGVITHVTALSDRLPARLLVSKGPEGSSVSWDR